MTFPALRRGPPGAFFTPLGKVLPMAVADDANEPRSLVVTFVDPSVPRSTFSWPICRYRRSSRASLAAFSAVAPLPSIQRSQTWLNRPIARCSDKVSAIFARRQRSS